MKQYATEKEQINKEKEKKNKKDKSSSIITKKDFGLSENCKVLME